MSKRHKKHNQKFNQPSSDRNRHGGQQTHFKESPKNEKNSVGPSENRRDYNERKNLDKDHVKPNHPGQSNPLHAAAKGLAPVPSVMTPTRQIYKKQVQVKPASTKTKKYGVLFFDTIQSAKSDIQKLKDAASSVDQLNIVIKAEPTQDDQELLALGKVFAGAAWTLIHERRVQDGWYEQPRD